MKCETPNTGDRGRRGSELFKNLPLIGEVLHCGTLTTPKNETTKKTDTHKGSKKSGFGKGWCGKFEKKHNEHITGCGFFANPVPYIPLFP